MPATIRVTPDGVWSDPGIEGLAVSDAEWRLDVDRYREFLLETTGISTSALSSADCYRIGNRLQALVEQRKRDDEWGPEVVEDYPDVETLEEFLWLARFFRACHDCHDAGEVVVPGGEPEETCVASR